MATAAESEWFTGIWGNIPGVSGTESLSYTSTIDEGTGVAIVQFFLPVSSSIESLDGTATTQRVEYPVTAWYNPETTELGIALEIHDMNTAQYILPAAQIPREVSGFIRRMDPVTLARFFNTPDLELPKPVFWLAHFFQTDYLKWVHNHEADPRVFTGIDASGTFVPWVDENGISIGTVQTMTSLNSLFESLNPTLAQNTPDQINHQWDRFISRYIRSTVSGLEEHATHMGEYIDWFMNFRRFDLALRMKLLGIADADEKLLGMPIEESNWYKETFGSVPVDTLVTQPGELPEQLSTEGDWLDNWAFSSQSTLTDVMISKTSVEDPEIGTAVMLIGKLPIVEYEDVSGQPQQVQKKMVFAAIHMGGSKFTSVELALGGSKDRRSTSINRMIIENWDSFSVVWDDYCARYGLTGTVVDNLSQYGTISLRRSQPVSGLLLEVLHDKQEADITIGLELELTDEMMASLAWQRGDYMTGVVQKLQGLYPHASSFIEEYIRNNISQQ